MCIEIHATCYFRYVCVCVCFFCDLFRIEVRYILHGKKCAHGCGIYARVVDLSEIERVRFLIQKEGTDRTESTLHVVLSVSFLS